MSDLRKLPHQLQERTAICRAVIETPKGSRNKVAYDPESGVFALKAILPAGLLFPFDFGFIPSTCGDDGDPLDILLFMEPPAPVGCAVDVRVIGILHAKQTERGRTVQNDRVIGVVKESLEYAHLRELHDVSKRVRQQIEAFFVSYNQQRGKTFTIQHRGNAQAAVRAIRKATVRAR